MTVVDLSKQQALDADPRAIQQINFTPNLDRENNTRFFFILERALEIFILRNFHKEPQNFCECNSLERSFIEYIL